MNGILQVTKPDINWARVDRTSKHLLVGPVILFLGVMFAYSLSGGQQVLPEKIIDGELRVVSDSTKDVNIPQMIERARELAKNRFFEQAEELLTDILRIDSENIYAVYELATILSWHGKYDKSIALYRKLLKLQPENTGLHREIGRVMLWKADRTKNDDFRRDAIAEFRIELEYNQNDCYARKQVGATQLKLGHIAEAIVDLDSAVQLCSGDEEAKRLLAEALLVKKCTSHAIGLFRELVDRTPQNPDLRWEFADALAKAGQVHRAEEQYRMILKDYPSHTASLIGLGWLLLWKGEIEEAKNRFEFAIKVDTGSPDGYVGLGYVEFRRRHWRASKRLYSQALAFDPKNILAKESLSRLRLVAGPGLKSEFYYLDATNGLNKELTSLEVRASLLQPIVWKLGYRRWRFVENSAPELHRNDFYLSWEQQVHKWLCAELQYSVSNFSDKSESAGNLYASSASLVISPTLKTRFIICYSRTPVSESYSTISSRYYSDALGTGFDQMITQHFSIQANASIIAQHGLFPIGYWNSYHQKWVMLGFLHDQAQRRAGEVQITLRPLSDPIIFIRGGVSTQQWSDAKNVPYWAPASFPQEKISLAIIRAVTNSLNLQIEVKGNHVHEGSQWGYGAFVSLMLRLWNVVQVSTYTSIDELATRVPWNGRTIGVTLQSL